MKEIFKKQKRKIVIKITAVLLVVWLIVSVVFSAIVLTTEKDKQITKSHNDYNYLLNAIDSMQNQPYNEMCKYAEVVKSQMRDIVTLNLEPKITCGADGTYNKDLQIALTDIDPENTRVNATLIDTDKEIYVAFYTDKILDISQPTSGVLNYDDFVASITQEQLDTIIEHLKTPKDKNGYFYLLRCKETYYNPENGHIYPKTVEIVKGYEDSYGYGIGEIIETFTLNPEGTENLELFVCSSNESCIIDGQFVCNDFSSGGLMTEPYFKLDYNIYDPYTGIVEKEGLFTYKCTEGTLISVDTLTYEGSELAKSYVQAENKLYNDTLFQSDIQELEDEFQNSVIYKSAAIGIRYAKRINLLECCGNTLIFGISAIFLFFLIIGLILSIMMCKVIKTQLSEEEKRREVTNALAHDIKTPLFIISGYAQNLKENVNSEKREHYSDKIIERTNEVNELVHKMLDFTRLERLDSDIVKEPVDLYLLTKEISEKFSDSKIENEIRINKNGDSVITGNRELLTRALTNLLENAVRYSDENTPVIIEINDRTISFSNTCSSITQEDIKHLTQPYYRGEKNRQSKGNGLGLSIVKSIVDIHNFTLDITLKDNVITFMIKSK